ncbi:hypothetical protein DXG01_003354 [Tephrocybe rancida]|nr:hypothetical protein DXG01_003354 [Tephrocybe rancida]
MPPGDGRSKERVMSHEARGSIVPEIRELQDSVEDEEGLSQEAGSAESDVLADLEAIEASHFIGQLGTDTQSLRRYSIRPDTDVASLARSSSDGGFGFSSASGPLLLVKGLDNVLDYYSFTDSPEPTMESDFRPPFSYNGGDELAVEPADAV